ncbi:MAG TPA: circadian clock KaiB family protein [Steroidobacteraceae bacterium]|nr:circadian clock KaiB family protein [Steroidobacteraceae bacterium]
MSDKSFSEAADELDDPHYVLRLFVTGMTPRSTRAIRAVRTLCEKRLKDRFELEIVDVYQQPQMIQGEQVFATPTLIKYEPAPMRRIIGDMTDTNRLCAGLGLTLEAST